jgi:hypothetical protein
MGFPMTTPSPKPTFASGLAQLSYALHYLAEKGREIEEKRKSRVLQPLAEDIAEPATGVKERVEQYLGTPGEEERELDFTNEEE